MTITNMLKSFYQFINERIEHPSDSADDAIFGVESIIRSMIISKKAENPKDIIKKLSLDDCIKVYRADKSDAYGRGSIIICKIYDKPDDYTEDNMVYTLAIQGKPVGDKYVITSYSVTD